MLKVYAQGSHVGKACRLSDCEDSGFAMRGIFQGALWCITWNAVKAEAEVKRARRGPPDWMWAGVVQDMETGGLAAMHPSLGGSVLRRAGGAAP